MSEPLWMVRDYKNEDFAFVKSCFLRGIYYGNSWYNTIPKDIFMENYSKVAEAMINSPKKVIKVACLKDEEDVILGYSVMSFDFSTIDFVFVKSAFRKRGIGRSLVPKFPKYVTHLTELGKTLLPKLKDCVFNPFAL